MTNNEKAAVLIFMFFIAVITGAITWTAADARTKTNERFKMAVDHNMTCNGYGYDVCTHLVDPADVKK